MAGFKIGYFQMLCLAFWLVELVYTNFCTDLKFKYPLFIYSPYKHLLTYNCSQNINMN